MIKVVTKAHHFEFSKANRNTINILGQKPYILFIQSFHCLVRKSKLSVSKGSNRGQQSFAH